MSKLLNKGKIIAYILILFTALSTLGLSCGSEDEEEDKCEYDQATDTYKNCD